MNNLLSQYPMSSLVFSGLRPLEVMSELSMVMIWERKLVEQGAWVGNVGWGCGWFGGILR